MNALIIINSKKGKSTFSNHLYDICHILTRKEYEISIKLTSKEINAYDIVIQKRYDLYIVAGGDGTINEVVNAVSTYEDKPDVMYFPTGTVNDFGNSLGLQTIIQRQLVVLRRHKVKEIDSGLVNGKYFNYVCGFGPFTRTSYITTHYEKNKYGKLAYIKNMFDEIPELLNSYHMDVIVDGEKISGEFTYALIINSVSVAGFRKFLKNDKMDDGLFNLILVGKSSAKTLTQAISLISKGFDKNFSEDSVIYRKFKKLSIQTDDDIQWTLDGEKGPIGSVEIEVIPKNLRMLVP